MTNNSHKYFVWLNQTERVAQTDFWAKWLSFCKNNLLLFFFYVTILFIFISVRADNNILLISSFHLIPLSCIALTEFFLSLCFLPHDSSVSGPFELLGCFLSQTGNRSGWGAGDHFFKGSWSYGHESGATHPCRVTRWSNRDLCQEHSLSTRQRGQELNYNDKL